MIVTTSINEHMVRASVYIDRDSDRDSGRDRDKNNREKKYIDRVRDAK